MYNLPTKYGGYEAIVNNNSMVRATKPDKYKADRCAYEFIKFLKLKPNWTSMLTYREYECTYIEYIKAKNVRDPLPFQVVWPLLIVHLEAFFFVFYLRQSQYFMRRISKENLGIIYTSEYRARFHLQQNGPTVVVPNYHKVLKSAIFTGKLFELDGYIFVGDTESALAEALNEVPDEVEMMRRQQLKQYRPDAYCEICDVRCPGGHLNDHLNGRRHKVQWAIGKLRDEVMKDKLLRDKFGVRILMMPPNVADFDPASGSYCVEKEPNERLTFMLAVKNDNASQPSTRRDVGTSTGAVIVDEILFFFKTEHVFFSDAGSGLLRKKHPVEVPSGGTLNVQITCMPQRVASRTVVPFMVVCHRSTNEPFRILRFITIECVTDKNLYRMLKPQTPYVAGAMNYVPPPLTRSAPKHGSDSESDSDNEEETLSSALANVKLVTSHRTVSAVSKLKIGEPKPSPAPFKQATSTSQEASNARPSGFLGRLATYAPSFRTPPHNSAAGPSSSNASSSPISAPVKESVQVDTVGDKQVVRAPMVSSIRKPIELQGLRLREIGEHPVSARARTLHRTAAKMDGRKSKKTVADELLDTLLSQKVDETNINMRFELLLHLEEVQMELDITRYAIKNAKLVRKRSTDGKNVYTLQVPGVIENRPGVIRGDILLVTLEDKPNMVYEAAVETVDDDMLRLLFPPNFVCIENETVPTVHFQVDRLPMRFQHETLLALKRVFTHSHDGTNRRLNALSVHGELSVEAVFQDRLRVMLFPSRSRLTAFSQQPLLTKLQPFFNRSLNPEQQRCVQNIVQNTHHPVPFLIYGPPGTGKTVTLSEAVKQVYNCCANSFILACAPENTSADHLVQTICMGNTNVEPRKVLRLYAASRHNKVPDFAKVAKCTVDFLDDGYPTAEQIKSYRIVITTLNTAARLAFSGFPRDHFTHMFVDEAGHAMESEVYIPIAFLLNLTRNTGGQLIMAGDPRQLGVTVRSSVATNYHLERSFFERLITNCDLYLTESCAADINRNLDHDPDSLAPLNIPPSSRVEYDERLLVKLRRNYRSHDAIIAFSRQRFYHNQLEAYAAEDSKQRFLGWELLPNKNCPVIFHPVIGSDEREGSSPSYFNRHEVMVIDTYLNALLLEKRGVKIEPKDIGIISPYRAQNIKLRKMIEAKRYDGVAKAATATTARSDVGILVSTVEEFQGQERIVIIISTVRSSAKLLRTDAEYQVGFVDRRKQKADSLMATSSQSDGRESALFERDQEMNVYAKRLNVALTRAKSLLIVVGNPFILEQDRNWKIWLDQCAANGAWTTERSQVEKMRGTALVNDVIVQDNNDMNGPENVSMIELQEEPQWVRRE